MAADKRPGVCDFEVQWCAVPGGLFLYQGQQTVNLPTFWAAQVPVTFAQFAAFLEARDGYSNPAWWDDLADRVPAPPEEAFLYANHPRDRVSWFDAVAFSRWLEAARKRGALPTPPGAPADYIVRLPTEAEWECAARGSTANVYAYDGPFDPARTNTREAGIGSSSAVGMFVEAVAPCGALDMSGNVWEWCLNDYQQPTQTSPERLGTPGSFRPRAHRGGSWFSPAECAAVTFRSYVVLPADRGADVGLRLFFAPPL
jgi:formylglycine-generating enzyme required for sulfatase activity